MSVLGILFDVFLLLVTPVLVLIGIIAASRKQALSFSLRGWLRFPLAIILTFGLEFALSAIFLASNPYLYESTHRPVLILALASLAYLCSHIPISLISLARPEEHHELKLLFEAYILWWFFLALPFGWLIGRAYSRLIFIALASALLAGLFDRWYAAKHGAINLDDDHEAPLLQPQRTESPSSSSSSSSDSSSVRRHQCDVHWKTSAISGAFDIPFVLLLGTQVAFLFHLATRADYTSINAAFVQTTLAVIVVMLPLAPFTHHFHRVATTMIALVLVACTILALATFPFSRATPLRLQFSHSIDLVDGSTFTELAGPHGYFEDHIKPGTSWRGGNDVWLQLPATRTANCTNAVHSRFHENELPNAYGICRWPGPTTRMWPWPPSHWITDFDRKPLGLTRGVLVVSGPAYTHFSSLSLDPGVELDTRNIYSEELTDELTTYKKSDPGDDGRRGVPWERIFVVEWDPRVAKGRRGGHVVVGWDESPDPGDIPDLHALRAGVPDWVRVTGPRGNMPQVDGFRRFDF